MEPGQVICRTPANVPVVVLCNYARARARTGYMFHFGSLVPAPVQLGKHSCAIPSQFQSLGRLYVPLPFTCSGSVSPWGTFPLRHVSCSTTASFSLRQISRPIQETHDLLAVIALPGFQFAIQLECSFLFDLAAYIHRCFFDLFNIDNSLLPSPPTRGILLAACGELHH